MTATSKTTSEGQGIVRDFQLLSEIAERIGTPCFVYDIQALEASVTAMREALPNDARLAFAMKANPSPGIVRFFAELGLGMEVASAGELRLALGAGVRPCDIFFSGPAKTEGELRAAVAAGIGAIHIESRSELVEISRLAQEADTKAAVALRVRLPAVEDSRRLGWGAISPFGMDITEAFEIATRPEDFPGAAVIGLHNHQTAQMRDPKNIKDRISAFARFAVEWRGIHPLHYINFGGGIFSPFYADETPFDLAPLKAAFRGIASGPLAGLGAGLVAEPGRYLVGAAGTYLVRVVRLRDVNGKRFAFVDGGTHHAHLLSGTVRTLRRPVAVDCVRRECYTCSFMPVEIAGPLCTPVDRLASDAMLPEDLTPGDLLAFWNCGAYARYASPLAFLGHDLPPEVLINRLTGNEVVITQGGQFEQVLNIGSTCAGREQL